MTITDDEALGAMRELFAATHNVAEGAGAAAWAAIQKQRDSLRGLRVGCVLSGGNAGADLFRPGPVARRNEPGSLRRAPQDVDDGKVAAKSCAMILENLLYQAGSIRARAFGLRWQRGMARSGRPRRHRFRRVHGVRMSDRPAKAVSRYRLPPQMSSQFQMRFPRFLFSWL